MKTPICDFVSNYQKMGNIRLHMPGHKGVEMVGGESRDITEIVGADSLYEASGIILESERCASSLFGCDTYYSTEGSSHVIRAMMYLVCLYAAENGERPLVLAARNCHKAFVSAAAMLDFDVEWFFSDKGSYLSCDIDPDKLDKHLATCQKKPTALYLTSPDYLGAMADIEAISRVCKRHGVLLCVDNAHGAYLRFLEDSRHPIDLGADICCDSAHKTLPVLTGGAYMHVGKDAPSLFLENVKEALLMFGSTSPSYLILQSLDKVNSYLEDGYRDKLCVFSKKTSALKHGLLKAGYELFGDEPLKITVKAKKYGYYGYELSEILMEKGIVCEFCDDDYTVLMLTPEIEDRELEALEVALLSIEKRPEINISAPTISIPKRAVSIREASMSPCETVSVDECEGRVIKRLSLSCPPAVPIAVAGEVIDMKMIECFKYYGINTCTVIKK